MNIKLTDILTTRPGGRAQLRVPYFPTIFLLPTAVRDYHPMGGVQQWFVGAMA